MRRAIGCLLFAGCPSGDPRPPEACREGPADLRFSDVSEAWGLRDLGVVGVRVGAADIDGDGDPDLLVSSGTQEGLRDDFSQAAPRRTRFVLRNDGGRFTDVTADSGFTTTRDGAAGRAYSYALTADLDNDGDRDNITVTEAWTVDADSPDTGDRSEVMLRDGDAYRLVDVGAEASDLSERFDHSTAASLLDADRDGNLDLFVGNQFTVFGLLAAAESDRLFLGRGDGRFRDRTEDFGLLTEHGGSRTPEASAGYNLDEGAHVSWPTFGTLACDIDNDGDPDILTQTYGRGLNQYWDNRGGSFVNVTAGSGWSSDDDHDYSGDENFRCYCANEGASATDCASVPAPRIACSPGSWLPGWDDQPHRLGGNTFAATCADFDGDGDMDVATGEIHHWWAGDASDRSTILWNQGGSPARFTREPLESTGLLQTHDAVDWNEGDLTVGAFDFDGDGVIDLLRPQSDYDDTRMYLYRGLGGGRFEDVAEVAGIDFPRAAGHAVADFDGDGDLDVVTAFSTMRCDASCPYSTADVHLFENRSGQDANALSITLRGRTANRDGVGARVSVTAGGRTMVRELLAGVGHQGAQSGLDVHVGLGGSCVADSVSVRWPDADGTVETWERIPANRPVTFAQGEAMPIFAGWAP